MTHEPRRPTDSQSVRRTDSRESVSALDSKVSCDSVAVAPILKDSVAESMGVRWMCFANAVCVTEWQQIRLHQKLCDTKKKPVLIILHWHMHLHVSFKHIYCNNYVDISVGQILHVWRKWAVTWKTAQKAAHD